MALLLDLGRYQPRILLVSSEEEKEGDMEWVPRSSGSGQGKAVLWTPDDPLLEQQFLGMLI